MVADGAVEIGLALYVRVRDPSTGAVGLAPIGGPAILPDSLARFARGRPLPPRRARAKR